MIKLSFSFMSRVCAVSALSVLACNEAAPVDSAAASTAMPASAAMQPAASMPAASQAAAGSGGGRPAQSVAAMSPGKAAGSAGAGAAVGAQAAGAAGMPAAQMAAGAAAAAISGSAGAAAGSGAAGSSVGVAGAGASAGASAQNAAGSGAAGQGAAGDDKAIASGLHELFLDVPCDSATRAPLEQGATCNHPPNTQHIEKMVKLAGEAGKNYKITLRVRGIWEPTNIMGGMRPSMDMPFTVGGMIASGAGSSSDSINYQQYYIEVAEPKQTYWLNDYQYVAHDIHKEDYEASITVGGGTQVKVVMNDGNEREIANFPKEMFSDIPPYDKMPSLGQSLRLDVVSVEPAP